MTADRSEQTVGFHRYGFTPSGTAYTFLIDTRVIGPEERGPHTWPRTTTPKEHVGVVVTRVKAWEGSRADAIGPPLAEWTFQPHIAPRLNGVPCTPGRVQHILNAAAVEWPTGGRPRRSGRYRNSEELHAAVDPIIRSIHAGGLWPSQERVVEYLPKMSDRADPGEPVNPRQLRSWVKNLLHMTWEQYLASLGIIK